MTVSHAQQLQKELWHVMYKSPLREKTGKFYVTGISFTIINSLTISSHCRSKGRTTSKKELFGHVVAPTGAVSALSTASGSHGIKPL